MSKKLFITGTGLFAQVARLYFDTFTEYEVVAFACHQEYMQEPEIEGLPVVALESITDTHPAIEYNTFVALGYKNMNKMRQRIYEEMKSKGYNCANFVHPDVHVWDNTELGDNLFIFEDNTIQPYTKIGSNTVLWSGNHIGHHSTIGDNVFISSHVVISGSCHVNDNVFIGVNATLRDSITIAEETLIGAGAVIMKDTKPKEVYPPQATKVFSKNSEEIGF
ncbi:MAG: acetyltransferase [Alphaproteobacteria bacterium]|nr:acetyltransferase [Alphaproteobacteria bacterium]